MPLCRDTKRSSWLFPSCYGNRAMSSFHMFREEHGLQSMPCSTRIISEILPEIRKMEKCDFLDPIIHSQII